METRGTPEKVVVRPYRPEDREAVRRLCCDTGDAGSPADSFFPDRELFADLITSYYTDHEPESLWVAELRGRVVGYLTGCLDDGRASRFSAWTVFPKAAWGALRRGTVLRPWFLRLILANLFLRRAKALPSASRRGHLHINLAPEARGAGAGRALAEVFLSAAKKAGVAEIGAAVRADNAGGRRFFEAMGFVPARTRVGYRVPAPAPRTYDVVDYGRRL
jgi:ribosomal protein S18 acetylase RimI-like enzyme